MTKETDNDSALSTQRSEKDWSLQTFIDLLGAKGKAVWNAIASLGPRALRLWPAGSKNLLKHQIGKEAIAGWKQSLELENENFAKVEGQLLDQIPAAGAEKLLEIESKLEFLRGKRNQMDVVAKALGYITEKPSETPIPTEQCQEPIQLGARTKEKKLPPDSTPISGHWMDHFNRLARQRNEPWRAELLARVLAVESENVGTVSPRALFVIGTLEETAFHQFVFWLNHCVHISTRLLLPWGDWANKFTEIPNLGEKWSFATLRTELQEIGLTSGYGSMECEPDIFPYSASYGDQSLAIKVSNEPLQVQGSFCTTIGEALAKYHSYEPTELGRDIFNGWAQNIEGKNVKVTKSKK